jgi:DNA-binding transcriptional LysR family regulator
VDLKDLKYFVAAYEANNFMHASIPLATVPSNVSMRIRRLEEDLGVILFVRRRRGVAPTNEGNLLYGYAKEFLGKIEEARDRVKRCGLRNSEIFAK